MPCQHIMPKLEATIICTMQSPKGILTNASNLLAIPSILYLVVYTEWVVIFGDWFGEFPTVYLAVCCDLRLGLVCRVWLREFQFTLHSSLPLFLFCFTFTYSYFVLCNFRRYVISLFLFIIYNLLLILRCIYQMFCCFIVLSLFIWYCIII